ncbi:MAG: hypothetical protein WA888_06120 [Burkholderiaceae bacterium]
MRKSQLVGILLTLFFGPLGLFYSSVAAAIAMLILAVAIGSFTFFVGALFVWPFCVLLSLFTVHRHNRAVKIEERRHQQLVEATRPQQHR